MPKAGDINNCGSTLNAYGVWVGPELTDEERYYRRLEHERDEAENCQRRWRDDNDRGV